MLTQVGKEEKKFIYEREEYLKSKLDKLPVPDTVIKGVTKGIHKTNLSIQLISYKKLSIIYYLYIIFTLIFITIITVIIKIIPIKISFIIALYCFALKGDITRLLL